MGLVLVEPDMTVVLLAYADDMLLAIQNPNDLVQVQAYQSNLLGGLL